MISSALFVWCMLITAGGFFAAGMLWGQIVARRSDREPHAALGPVIRIKVGAQFYDPRLDYKYGGHPRGGSCRYCHNISIGECSRCGCFDRRPREDAKA